MKFKYFRTNPKVRKGTNSLSREGKKFITLVQKKDINKYHHFQGLNLRISYPQICLKFFKTLTRNGKKHQSIQTRTLLILTCQNRWEKSPHTPRYGPGGLTCLGQYDVLPPAGRNQIENDESIIDKT